MPLVYLLTAYAVVSGFVWAWQSVGAAYGVLIVMGVGFVVGQVSDLLHKFRS